MTGARRPRPGASRCSLQHLVEVLLGLDAGVDLGCRHHRRRRNARVDGSESAGGARHARVLGLAQFPGALHRCSLVSAIWVT